MNKQAYRVIFNVRRGALMAVAENVSSQNKSTSGSSGAASTSLPVRTGWMRLAQLGVLIAVLFGGVTVVQAQIVADRNAASRPVVDQSANGKPVVQIVTPNAAGVSHNRYDQFNVGQGGAILNNASALTQTQQAGYIAGNAALTNGSARLILNEVTGASRSQLNGYIEVAGQRAEVIVANPNGISCSGCGFINTSRGVLTTGTPELAADGSLANLRVTRGDITIGGNGMNAAAIDRVDLIARSVQVNGELWGNQLNVVTGANLVNYANLGVQVIQGQGSAPTVGIDLAQLGGMYANKIRLVGTEAGVGVRSLGNIAAQAGDISIDNSGKITLNGNTTATGNIAINGNDDVANGGNLYAQQAMQINASGRFGNTGTVAAQTDVSIQAHDIVSSNSIAAGVDASGNAATNGNLALNATTGIDNTGGRLYARSNLAARSGADLINTNGVMRSDGNIDATVAGALLNDSGRIEAAGAASTLKLASASVVNTNSAQVAGRGFIGGNGDVDVAMTNAFTNAGEVSAVGNLSLAAGNIDNSGLINSGATTVVRADTVRNVGRIYGDDIALAAQTLTNDVDNATSVAGVIAARNTLQIGAAQVTNREHALLQSLGDMTIAGALDADNHATGSAVSIVNESATIDAGGTLSLQTASLINRNNHFSTTIQDDAALTRHVTEYANWAAPDTWFSAGSVSWSDSGDGGIVLVMPNGDRFEKFYKRDYTEVVQKTVVLSSDPGRISAGGNMLLSGNVTNDKSVMVAGGALSGMVGAINNIGATGTETTVWHMTGGENYYHWVDGHPHQNHYTYNQGGAAYDNVMASTTLDLPVWSIAPNTAPTGITNPAVTAGAPHAGSSTLPPIVVPPNPLFRPGVGYVIETDPKFTNYKTFVSSDYMLSRLAVDPQTIQKRLGDGFYEQKVIGDQITELTGKRTLTAYATAEDQYKALMDAGVATAARFQLTPGIALTDAQMAALTSDIVWLVERDVVLPDGTQTKALAPVVYLSRASTEDLSVTGSLVSARDIDLTVNGSLNNGGTLLASSSMIVQATDINNTGKITSTGAAGSVALVADNDVTSSGSISGNRVGILAGRDVNLETTTASNMATDGLNTKIDRVSSIDAGQLIVQGGRDVNLVATAVNTSGDASVVAGRDLNLTAVKTQDSYNVTFDSNNHLNESSTQVFGAIVNTGGALTLGAVQDVNTQAAYVNAGSQLTVSAGRDVNVGSAQQESSIDQAIYTTSKGLLSSSSSRSQRNDSDTASVGSTLSGDRVSVVAGHDLNVTGSNIVGTSDVALVATNDVTIVTSQNTRDSRFESEEKKSGLLTSGLSITFGGRAQDNVMTTQSTTNNASTIGSTSGNVKIAAGNAYVQTGSSVLSPNGDIDISAKAVTINETYDTGRSTQDFSVKQSGLTLAITSPVISTIQTAQQMSKAANSTSDPRMKALAAAAAGLSASNTYDAIQAGQGSTMNGKENQIATGGTNPDGGAASRDANAADNAGGINLSISIGGSKSEAHSEQNVSTVRGSTVNAGGNVRIAATGGGSASNLLIQGSDVKAGLDAILKADNEVKLLAAQSTSEQHSDNKAISGSIGFSIGTDGLLFNAGLSGSKGRGDGNDVTNVNTHVDAGNQLTISSGTDTTLKGAVASGKQVTMDVGTSGSGNLNIESLQDVNTYKNNQQSLGGSISIGMGKMGGSINYSKSTMNSDFASVMEQSGIKAGDDGFKVNVAGNTDLKGGAIASSEKAIADDKNSLTTGSITQSDIQNRASYQAQSISIGGGYSGGKSGGFTATPPAAMRASGESSSVTGSGVSGGAISITDADRQAQRTGKTADQTIAAINRDVSTEKDGSNALKPIFNEKEIQAGFEIVGALTREVGTFLNNRAKEADAAKEAAKMAIFEENLKPEGERDDARVHDLLEQYAAVEKWSTTGDYRKYVTAIVGAASGNVMGSTAQFAQAAAVNYLQALGAEQVKHIADYLESDAARAALQGIVGCAGSSAQGANCAAGALGASAGTIVNALLGDPAGLSAEEKEERKNLVTNLIAGIATAAGSGDVSAATLAAQLETENNALGMKSFDLQKGMRECSASKDASCFERVKQLAEKDTQEFNSKLKAACEGLNKSLESCKQVMATAQMADSNLSGARFYATTDEQKAYIDQKIKEQVADVAAQLDNLDQLGANASLLEQFAAQVAVSFGPLEFASLINSVNSKVAYAINKAALNRGRVFQSDALKAADVPENKSRISVVLSDGTPVTVIPDARGKGTGTIIEVKDVVNISNSNQFRGYLVTNEKIELIVSPNTQTISKPLRVLIADSGGSIRVFDPATKTFSAWTPKN